MSWLKIQAGLVTNKKTARLASQMKWKKFEAIGFLVSFWVWALENCEDGLLRDITDSELAFAVGIDNMDGILEALKVAGLVDDNPLRIHDWPEHQNDYLRSKYRKSPEKVEQVQRQYRTSTVPVPDRDRVEIERDRVNRVDKKDNITVIRSSSPSVPECDLVKALDGPKNERQGPKVESKGRGTGFETQEAYNRAIALTDKFHDMFTKGGVCHFCGSPVKSPSICNCAKYNSELEKFKVKNKII